MLTAMSKMSVHLTEACCRFHRRQSCRRLQGSERLLRLKPSVLWPPCQGCSISPGGLHLLQGDHLPSTALPVGPLSAFGA